MWVVLLNSYDNEISRVGYWNSNGLLLYYVRIESFKEEMIG